MTKNIFNESNNVSFTLSDFIGNRPLKFKIESNEEEHLDDAKLRRLKDKYLFLAVIGFFLLTLFVCLYLAIFRPEIPGTISAASNICFAFAGYFVRGKQ